MPSFFSWPAPFGIHFGISFGIARQRLQEHCLKVEEMRVSPMKRLKILSIDPLRLLL
jgi:hypothetical protein